jgi:hypothetical protein
MVRTVCRRFSLVSLVATALLAGGLPALTGIAHAATITPTPNTAANNGSQTFTINDATAPFLVTGATLTKSDDSSVTIAGSTTSTTTQVKATFQLYRAYPGTYNLTLTGPAANSCNSCVTITGLPPALDLTTPAKIFPGDDPAPGSVHLTNPLRGSKYKGRIQLTFSNVANLQPSQFAVYDATNSASPTQIPLTADAGTLVGYIGAASGFTVDQGYNTNTPLLFELKTESNVQNRVLHVDAAFGNVANDGSLSSVQATDASTITLSGIPRGAVFHPTAPTRLVDTRQTGQGGALASHEAREYNFSAIPNLQDATAMVVNVTTVSGSQFGTVTVYPFGTNPDKGEGNVAYRPGRTIANVVSTPISTDHRVLIRNNGAASVHIVVDLEGYYTPRKIPGDTFTAIAPKRLIDTRRSPNHIVAPGGTIVLDKLSDAGVPSSATAIAVTIIVISPARAGYVTAYPKGATAPLASTVSFVANRLTNNLALVKLGSSPSGITIRNGSSGTLHLAVDLSGYFTPSSSGAVLHALRITRVIDTRDGTGTTQAPLPAHGGRTIALAGKGGLPSSGGAHFVELNITAVTPQGNGYLIAFPGDTTTPYPSVLNYAQFENVAAVTIIRLPANGFVTFSNGGSSTVELVVDVVGWGNIE